MVFGVNLGYFFGAGVLFFRAVYLKFCQSSSANILMRSHLGGSAKR